MDVVEAGRMNEVVNWFTEQKIPTSPAVHEALTYLAEQAFRTLGAGVNATDVAQVTEVDDPAGVVALPTSKFLDLLTTAAVIGFGEQGAGRTRGDLGAEVERRLHKELARLGIAKS